jgi:hypothetical protein
MKPERDGLRAFTCITGREDFGATFFRIRFHWRTSL